MKNRDVIEQQLKVLTKQKQELLREKEESTFFYMQKGRKLEAVLTSIKTLKWVLNGRDQILQP